MLYCPFGILYLLNAMRPRILLVLTTLAALTALFFNSAPVFADDATSFPGFAPNERVTAQATFSDGLTRSLPDQYADNNGVVRLSVTPDPGWPSGQVTLVLHGTQSGHEATASFNYQPGAVGGGGGGGASGYAFSGFAPNERVLMWATFSDGITRNLPDQSANNAGTVVPQLTPDPGWPSGQVTVVLHGTTSGHEVKITINYQGIGGSGPGATANYTKYIVNPQGPGVYLNTDYTQLYYFDCNWKWRPMSGVIYFLVLGFQPGETVNVEREIFGLGRNYYTTLHADGSGNVAWAWDSTGAPRGHYHWHFIGSSAYYCGHYDLP